MKNNKLLLATTSILIILIAGVSIILLISDKRIYLGESQILYLFSTSAQVIAGLFGLTLAGYGFLKSSLDRSVEEDETLSTAVDILKRTYFHSIIAMSVYGIFAIILSLFCIFLYQSESEAYSWLLNITGILVCIEVSFIISFSCNVLDPNKIIKVSNATKNKLAKILSEEEGVEENLAGSLSEFLKDFNAVEELITEFISYELDFFNGKSDNRRISFRQRMAILKKYEILSAALIGELIAINKYRNTVVHSSQAEVTKAACQRMKEIRIGVDSAISQAKENRKETA